MGLAVLIRFAVEQISELETRGTNRLAPTQRAIAALAVRGETSRWPMAETAVKTTVADAEHAQ